MAEATSPQGTETTTVEGAETTETKATEQVTQQDEKDKREFQSQLDKAMAQERKKNAEKDKENANLRKEIEELKKEKMSEKERTEYENKKKAQELADKEKELTDRENRYFAVKAIKDAGLDDGSDLSLGLVDLVVSGSNDTEETIKAKVKTVSDLVKKMVASEVDKTFKANGRIPNGANVSADKKETTSIAEKLGKERATQNKKATDVLNYYIGGKK